MSMIILLKFKCICASLEFFHKAILLIYCEIVCIHLLNGSVLT